MDITEQINVLASGLQRFVWQHFSKLQLP